jgi:transcriptional regulator with XRE-family HTH domain
MSAAKVTSKKKQSNRRHSSVSIRDVAKRAGVSIATVSRAVNGITSVDPELAKRVWKAVEEVGYVPNPQARALVSGRSRILGPHRLGDHQSISSRSWCRSLKTWPWRRATRS